MKRKVGDTQETFKCTSVSRPPDGRLLCAGFRAGIFLIFQPLIELNFRFPVKRQGRILANMEDTRTELEGCCGWNLLPCEMVAYILALTTQQVPAKKGYSRDWVSVIVCRVVCRLWRSLVPPPSPRRTPNHEEIPFFFKFASTVAFRGHLSLLQWARANDCPWDPSTCAKAARGGHLEVLKWARENGCSWNESTCSTAARKGHLEVLMWAREQGCKWEAGSMASDAARGGNLELLKWVRERGARWDSVTCSLAARHGHLEVLKWLREQGCPWDSYTCHHAARGGHLEVLKWARANGCSWKKRACEFAASAGQLEVLMWLRENGCILRC